MKRKTIDKLAKHTKIITESQFYIAAAEYKAEKMISNLVIRKFTNEERRLYDNVNKIQRIHQDKWSKTVDEHFKLMNSIDQKDKEAIEREGIDKYLKRRYNVDVPRLTIEDQLQASSKVFGELLTFENLMKEGYMNNDVLFGERRKQRDEKLAQIEANFA